MFDHTQNNEECYILIGRRIGRLWYAQMQEYSLGNPHEVGFDPNYVFDNNEKVIGWIHSHPPGCSARASQTDNKTMHAWVCALGSPMLCCIIGREGLLSHWFFDDEAPAIQGKTLRVGRRLFGIIPKG